MHEWMPGPIFQTSQGGTSPIKENKEIVANIPLIMRLEQGGKKRIMRQPTLKRPEKGTSTTPQGGSRLDTTPVAGEGERGQHPAAGGKQTLPLQLKEFG